MTGPAPAARVLVAGIGNVFLGDDGFGVEVARTLAGRRLPDGVDLVNTGVRGVHLAYQLLDGYHTAVLVDVTRRGGRPGTVYLIETPRAGPATPEDALIDGHRMTPDAVLALLGTLSAGTAADRPRRVVVVGCEPERLAEGIGLSPPVAAAVAPAADLALQVAGEAAAAAPDRCARP
ncbi:hydrogenase maturation protease [Streptantibioticus cattleyicolor]|uniref:[NiFe] hydrogenase-specific C-terminal protease n=1 Tax=Streptantibioticus cattleyicolor (strain ATCC 35852 / DSM 46488 / JCM 4925 / NBRC 14057 / NRRL 8057) TaxID=1003195 RepID=F8JM48_STREN|nr:hydrogenase maturation protease [Streptantibioticus cattleyicolor]AEW99430.1 [NiFe] hydrogenase-specific C-terminal protease [Streptantibioticus cattleyicolor NRRL 8057 = DSM 46488]CCB71530.1 Hydrogenase-specific C-terminal protease [Streptantibioticus cattleyicolor NRRL 8057 = DSM 46488]